MASSIQKLMRTFVVCFLALSIGLVYWQVVIADNVTATPHNQRHYLAENCPLRGKIYDRNGIVLAESVRDDTVVCGYRRQYSDPSLANLIGYYVPNYPTPHYSVERTFDKQLSGSDLQNSLGTLVNQTLHTTSHGSDIYLTIDSRIQKLVNQDFDTLNPPDDFNIFPSNRGSVVVTDPHTGEVLAMVSRPSYDPNKMVQTLSGHAKDREAYYTQVEQENALLNRPLAATYIPGSIFKTVTLMAALDSGTYALNSPWNKEDAVGPVTYTGSAIGPDKNLGEGSITQYFPITTQYAYSNSDNVVFAQMGVKIGEQKWLDYNKRLLIGEDIPFDLPVLQSSVQNADGKPLSDWQLAENAFGQGVDAVTPFQMSLLDNTVANDGVLMKPYLVSKITDSNKQVLQTTGPQQLGQVISNQAAAGVRQSMFAVTRCNGGYPSAPIRTSAWGIMAKTGTAEVGGGLHPHSWMLTQAPYDASDPTKPADLSIVAMKENAGEAIDVIGPMIAKMYDDIFSQKLVKIQPPNNPDSDVYCPSHHLWDSKSNYNIPK